MSNSESARMRHAAVAIADVVESTALYERLGNVAAKAAVEVCLEILREETELHAGRVVKHMGDGLLCAFDSEREALLAAVGMCAGNEERGLPIRVGLHSGELIVERGEIFGDVVNTTSRIAALAKPFEVMLSADFRDALPPDLQPLARPVPPVSVKGKKKPLKLYRILVEPGGSGAGSSDTILDASATIFRSQLRPIARLDLVFRGETISMQPGTELAIGRDSSCAIRITDRRASRLHARIFMRRSCFVIADQSVNGTYLVPENRSKLHLLREEAPLFDSGSIFIGEDPDAEGAEAIRYRASS